MSVHAKLVKSTKAFLRV